MRGTGSTNDGQTNRSQHKMRDQAGSYTYDSPTREYFGADGKLRAMQRYVTGNNTGGAWEEYVYDALGRRVAVRTRRATRPPACDSASMGVCASLCSIGADDCRATSTYAVWDGQQLVHEVRQDYSGGYVNPPYFGIAQYVPGLVSPVSAGDRS